MVHSYNFVWEATDPSPFTCCGLWRALVAGAVAAFFTDFQLHLHPFIGM